MSNAHGRRALSLKRALISLVSLGLALSVSGCVGIPMSGPVTTGNVIDDELFVDPDFLPSGPRNGATQQEILLDFVQAATNPQDDYSIARQFLATNIRAKWNPNAGVAIRRNANNPVTAGSNHLDYTITTSARIDGDGRYSEDPDLGSQTLSFGFTNEGGEWRINEVADGIVLSEDNFDVVFSSHALYFFDPTYTYLVPDVRWFPNSNPIATRIASSLVKGQASWLAQGVLVSEFPSGTTLGDVVSVTSGTATVDLSEEARAASNVQRERMRQQLSASLANVRTVSSVVLTIGGVPLPIKDSGAVPAVKQPQVNSNSLIRYTNDDDDGEKVDEFGFVSGNEITPLEPMSTGVIAINATEATLGPGGATLAALAADGVWAIRASGDDPLRVDARNNLIAPSVDTAGYIWTVRGVNAASIRVANYKGVSHDVDTTTVPSGARIVSIDVSRDGTRILLYLDTDSGPKLLVAGIVRNADNLPERLGEPQELPIDRLEPIDATWVSDETVATISRSGADAVVSSHEIGGPGITLGRLEGGTAIVGGNGGSDGLRVLTTDGELYKPRGNSWQRTGTDASFIATQQTQQ